MLWWHWDLSHLAEMQHYALQQVWRKFAFWIQLYKPFFAQQLFGFLFQGLLRGFCRAWCQPYLFEWTRRSRRQGTGLAGLSVSRGFGDIEYKTGANVQTSRHQDQSRSQVMVCQCLSCQVFVPCAVNFDGPDWPSFEYPWDYLPLCTRTIECCNTDSECRNLRFNDHLRWFTVSLI